VIAVSVVVVVVVVVVAVLFLWLKYSLDGERRSKELSDELSGLFFGCVDK